MIDALAGAFAFEGLYILVAAVVAAGIVRGFTGFGTALIYVPVAATVLPPIWVLTTMVVYDIVGPLPLMPRALRDGAPGEVLRLMVGAVAGLALGLYLLTQLDPLVFRWMICAISLALLVLLASGWRYRRALGNAAKAGVGFCAGLFGGAAGLPGPPVILFYLGSGRNPAVVRANIMMFLVFFECAFLTVLALRGMLDRQPVAIGLLLIVPYAVGGLIGQAVFDPARERIYRAVSYAVIAGAALLGLPLLD